MSKKESEREREREREREGAREGGERWRDVERGGWKEIGREMETDREKGREM